MPSISLLEERDIVVCENPGGEGNDLRLGAIYTVVRVVNRSSCELVRVLGRRNNFFSENKTYSFRFRRATLADLFPSLASNDQYGIRFVGPLPTPPSGFVWVPYLEEDPNAPMWCHQPTDSNEYSWVVNDRGRRISNASAAAQNLNLFRLSQVGFCHPPFRGSPASITSRRPPNGIRSATLTPLPLP